MHHMASAMAHAGFAIFILGMTLTATLKQTYELPLDARTPMVMGDYTLSVRAAEKREEHNYITRRATIDITRDGILITTLTPELRFYAVRNMQTTEAALHSTLLRDLYLVLGEATYARDESESVLGLRLYVTPAQQWLWIGFLLAAMGGFVALIAALRSSGGTR
jgi:cytochrome c-type biogenesis protein CcmF